MLTNYKHHLFEVHKAIPCNSLFYHALCLNSETFIPKVKCIRKWTTSDYYCYQYWINLNSLIFNLCINKSKSNLKNSLYQYSFSFLKNTIYSPEKDIQYFDINDFNSFTITTDYNDVKKALIAGIRNSY